jgi:hypothetical protein
MNRIINSLKTKLEQIALVYTTGAGSQFSVISSQNLVFQLSGDQLRKQTNRKLTNIHPKTDNRKQRTKH